MDGSGQYLRPRRVFVGRLRELDALAAALAAARAGEPQVVLIQGDGGIGKSSLIYEFFGGQPRVPAIMASGDAAEAVLPYGVMQQLVAGAASASPGALAGLKLLSRGPRPDADPLAVGVELYTLICSLQGNETAALVVEDLQWADLPSAKALLFACRRLSAEHVLAILSCRPEGTSQLGEGWTRFVSGDRRASRLTLDGLDAGEIGMLCRQLGRTGLSERTVRRLADHTGGNPLLARALLAELTDEALKTANGFFRAPRSLAGLILPRLAALARPARDLVVAAAVLGDHCSLADAAAVADTAEPTAALDRAERAGFLFERDAASGRAVLFRHPLIRQAIYDDLGAERRRRLHLRAAATVGGQEALAHRTAAAVGSDPELAADLSAAAARAVDAGKLLLAARYLQHAAAVTERGPDRDEHALSAFELLVRAADVAAADTARPLIEQLPATARRDTALGQLALLAARPVDAEALLRAAWDARDPMEEGGGEAAFGLGMLLGMSGSYAESAVWLDRALGSGVGGEPWYDATRCIRSFVLSLGGDVGRALGLFGDLPGLPAMVPSARTDALAFRGIVRLCAGDLRAALEDLSLAGDRIGAGLQVRFPGPALAFLAEAEFTMGRWDESRTHAELAVTLADDADRCYDLALVHSAAVPAAACRGDWETADGHAEAAEQAARAFGGLAAIFAASARGILGIARDDAEEALHGAAQALAVPQIDHYDGPTALWWRPAQIWALVRTGDLGQAGAILAAFESRAADRGERPALAQARWLRGSLAMARGDLDQADGELAAARLTFRSLPFHRGLLDLEHGRCLSRLQRHEAAVDALRAAHDVFSILGARPFLRASESELSAAGPRPRPGRDPDLPGLTAQELRVTRLVASGMSNREAAAQLYLSPKTVEYHLAHAFTKLGVRSRHQLSTRVLDRETLGILTREKPREFPVAGQPGESVASTRMDVPGKQQSSGQPRAWS